MFYEDITESDITSLVYSGKHMLSSFIRNILSKRFLT